MNEHSITISHALFHELNCHMEMAGYVNIGHVKYVDYLVFELLGVGRFEPCSHLQNVRNPMLLQLVQVRGVIQVAQPQVV